MNFKTNLKFVLSLFIILLVVACVPQQDKKTVNTNGQAILEVQPDQAVVYVSIETLKDTAQVSKDNNNQIVEDIYSALYALGIERESVETSNFNIYEEFDWTEEGRVSKGFKTVHTLKITTEEFDDIGEIVDAAIEVGQDSVRISRINFDLSDEKQKEYKKQALAEASKDAKEKAEAIAEGLGTQLGDLVSISDATYDYRPYPLYDVAMAEAKTLEETVSTQISPQKLEIRADVQVTYEIK